GSAGSSAGRSASGTCRRFTRIRVQVEERPRIESTSTSSIARCAAARGWRAFQRSRPASASSRCCALAIVISGWVDVRTARRAADLVETPPALEAHVDVDPARTGRLRPAAQAALLQHVAHHEGDAANLVPAHARARVEVDAQLVGVLEVLGADRMRVEIDAS